MRLDTIALTALALASACSHPPHERREHHARLERRTHADHLHEAGCNVDFVNRTYGESGAHDGNLLWPLDRSASATAVVTP